MGLLGKRFLILFLFLALVAGEELPAQGVSHPKSVRVRLLQGLQSVQIRGVQLEIHLDGKRLQKPLESDVSKVQIERAGRGGKSGWAIKWNGEPTFRLYRGENLEIRGLNLRQGRLTLPRRIRFYSSPSRRSKFDLISDLNTEVYLFGVLPKEMPSSWPLEALKAQAVAARSYALAKTEERRNHPFDVESTVFDQAFEYSPAQSRKAKWSDRIQKAITATRGQVLTLNGQPVKAFYHADCGGKTEQASQVWGGDKDFNGAVIACFHPSSGQGDWSYELDRQTFNQKLRAFFGLEDSADFERVDVASLSPSGRVKTLLLKHLDSNLYITSQKLRQVLGFSQLKSTLFKIESTSEKVIFRGQGNGHGVGMCQYGARKMAESGKTYHQILTRYFPGTSIKTLKGLTDE